MKKIYTLSSDGSISSELESLLYQKENLEFQMESSQKELEVVNQFIERFIQSEKEERSRECV